jgi:hypothetical protein
VTKVLYISGWGRSGSTILDTILGQVDGFFSVGELRYLWDRGVAENRPCGCGAPFGECELWGEVLDRAFGGLDAASAREILAAGSSTLRTRHLPRTVARGPAVAPRFRDALERLYGAIAAVTGARVIVDSSKTPSYGAALASLRTLDVSVVHLVRDPRATAWSWLRHKPMRDADGVRDMRRHGVLYSSLMWDVINASSPLLWRSHRDAYLRLRYEDLVADPETALASVLALAGEPDAVLPFVGEHEVELAPTHTVSGNPSRFSTGRVTLRADDEWLARMPLRERLLVTAATAPFLHGLGYPLWEARP